VKKPLTRRWDEAEIARLRALAASGASAARASSALARKITSVTKMARKLGLHFAGVRELKAASKARNELAERDLRRGQRKNDGSYA
jgi:hypothetical protein